ncbi:MAG: PLDc N-terminal domain-containing protein [Solirubrobacterales bacterium]|nr:PLDc N-terminal domain-containing protein [Solirubrobacterales bacterium]
MELLATYTFGQALLTVLEFALLFLWIWLAVTVVIDVFRSQDLSGWAKAGWIVLIVLLPLLGVLVYVIARGDKMKAHEVSGERLQERAFIADVEDLRDRGILTDDQVRRVRSKSQPITGAQPSPDDDVAELEVLRERGILSDEEFKSAKQRALAA